MAIYSYNAITPLRWDETTLESFRVLTAAGIPISVQSSPIIGLTAPVTLAGSISLANAEILSGIVINRLYHSEPKCQVPLLYGFLLLR